MLPFALPRGGIMAAALCVGAMIPDLPYFMPIRWGAEWTHHPLGLVIADLPLGVLVTICWLRWLQQPALSLTPLAFRKRLRTRTPAIDSESVRVISIGVLIGAATHILWDSFTHHDGLAVGQIAALSEPMLSISGIVLPGYKVAQHLSTVVGLIAVLWLARRWLRKTPPHGLQAERPTTDRARNVGRLSIVGGTLAFAGLHALLAADEVPATRVWLTVTGAIQGTLAAALVYALWWHRRAPRHPGRS